MQSKSKSFFKASIPIGLMIVGAVSGMLVLTDTNKAIVENSIVRNMKSDASWHLIPLATEGNPGAGAGGILEVFFINYTAGTIPDRNSSATLESWSDSIGWNGWNNSDNFRQKCNISKFYIVVRVRGNATQCNRTTFWQDTDLRVRWTCADLSIGADTVMERVVTQNGTGSYLWVNFYDDNGNAGFNLDKSNTWPDNPVNITSIKFEAYY